MALFVAPSRNEGVGLTPLEAIAYGAALVDSDAGAYAEMKEPDKGRVVPAGDGAALTAAIETCLADPEAAAAEGRAARLHVEENFALERESSALIALYRALAGGMA
jgi:mannosyltransferase